jgi:5-deoxy-glucuronate isomerase
MNWFKPNGSLAREGWNAVVDDSIDGWHYTGLRVADLGEGENRSLSAGRTERIIIPLWGSFEVSLEGSSEQVTVSLAGRRGPFFGPTDVVYAPIDTSVTIEGTGRVAVAEGPASQPKQWRHLTAAEVPVEIRGAGAATRQVHNFGTPGTLDADRLIVCEVITPSANWSSFPSHKHDEFIPGSQSNLEEIYYFESFVARGFDPPESAEPMGYFRNYGTDERPIDTLAEVRSGDVALVPHGWHGPATAAPGYDLYYLNVMAGPDPDRSWNIAFDARHGWLNEAWEATPQDPRLPYLSEETQ